MRILQIILIVVLSIVFILVMGGCFVYRGYTRAIDLDENVHNTWAQVENQLQRRYDLIPNLVETVKGVASQEKQIYLGVAEARKAYFQSQDTPAERAKAASGVERALSRLLVLREQYPQLRSNEAFQALMVQLEGSENRLSVERKRYNDAVRAVNAYVRKPFGGFCARLAGVGPAEYFEIEEAARTRPTVNFTGDGA